MTYLQALRLMVKAYKAARGAMPKGLDLLKMKMKARQKAIDSQKVVQAADRFDKGNWFKLNRKPAKEGFGKPKKVETEAEMLVRMKRQNKEAAQRLRDKKKPRDDKATGGLANISQTYDNNPTLQSQFPNKQDYLDLFSSTTTTTPQTQTYAQMTQQSPAGIPAVKPIVPIIPQRDSGDGGGGITNPGINRFDYGYDSLAKNTLDEEGAGGYKTRGTDANIAFLDDIGEGTIPDEDYTLGMRLGDTVTGLGNFYKKVSPFLNIKKGFEKAREFAEEVRAEKAKQELAAQLAAAQEEINRMGYQDYGSGGGLDPSLNDPVTGEYTGASKQDYGSGE